MSLSAGIQRAIPILNLRTTRRVALGLFALSLGFGVIGRARAQDSGPVPASATQPAEAKPANPRPEDEVNVWELTRDEVIEVALDKFADVQVVKPDFAEIWAIQERVAKRCKDSCGMPQSERFRAPYRAVGIESKVGGVDPLLFKSSVMSRILAVERQYCDLQTQQIEHWAAECVLDAAKAIEDRELAKRKIGRGNDASLREVREEIGRLRTNLDERIAEKAESERQLRKLMGVAEGQQGQILPVSGFVEAPIALDRATCLAVMLAKQPNIGRSRSAEDVSYRQVVQQRTDALETILSDVAINFREFQDASRLKRAALRDLESRKSLYEARDEANPREFLEALRNWAVCVVREAEFRCRYNTSILALEQAKGTLLEFDKIFVAEEGRLAIDRIDPSVEDVMPFFHPFFRLDRPSPVPEMIAGSRIPPGTIRVGDAEVGDIRLRSWRDLANGGK